METTPHIIQEKRANLVPSTVKLLHREKERKNQWGSRGLQAWPETGSWWELITVLERASLVWTSLAAKFKKCTWSLEVSFLTLHPKLVFSTSSFTISCETFQHNNPDLPLNWCSRWTVWRYGQQKVGFESWITSRVGQINIYTVYIYGIFGREITQYTVIYGA